GADSEAIPAAGRRRERAEGARSARRRRGTQVALGGAGAGAVTRAMDTEYGSGADTGYDPDAEYGATAGTEAAAAQGFAPRTGRPVTVGAARASAYGSEPGLDVTPHIDEGA